VQTPDLAAHLDTQLGVEIAQRLVEQEQHRFAHQRPSHRDTLPLSAGQHRRLALK
jgi:hypothetical protein